MASCVHFPVRAICECSVPDVLLVSAFAMITPYRLIYSPFHHPPDRGQSPGRSDWRIRRLKARRHPRRQGQVGLLGLQGPAAGGEGRGARGVGKAGVWYERPRRRREELSSEDARSYRFYSLDSPVSPSPAIDYPSVPCVAKDKPLNRSRLSILLHCFFSHCSLVLVCRQSSSWRRQCPERTVEPLPVARREGTACSDSQRRRIDSSSQSIIPSHSPPRLRVHDLEDEVALVERVACLDDYALDLARDRGRDVRLHLHRAHDGDAATKSRT